MGYSSKSPWLIHYDGSSCNGCDIEVLDSLTPLYDIERFGIINTGNPKHADIFLVTGSVNHQNINVVKHIYEQMLEPKVVVRSVRLHRRRVPRVLQRAGRRGQGDSRGRVRPGLRRSPGDHHRRGAAGCEDSGREGRAHAPGASRQRGRRRGRCVRCRFRRRRVRCERVGECRCIPLRLWRRRCLTC